jgi:nucleotide-binding universal stress UspA family protein
VVSKAEGDRASQIVVGVDGSGESIAALDWAAREAKVRDVPLLIMHATMFREEFLAPYPEERSIESEVLERALELARQIIARESIEGRIVEPPPGQALVEASKGAALLVVGSRGLGGVARTFLGSVSQECATRASCPVVIVRNAPNTPTSS